MGKATQHTPWTLAEEADAAWQEFTEMLEAFVPSKTRRTELEDLAITAVMFHELAAERGPETLFVPDDGRPTLEEITAALAHVR